MTDGRIYYGGDLTGATLVWFRVSAGVCGIDPHLTIIYPVKPPAPPGYGEKPEDRVSEEMAPPTDVHVRRSGSDYAEGLANLLPTGPAWPRDIASALMKTVYGLAEIWGLVDSRAADLLEQESDPRKTLELLPDWERNWGLPDPCYTVPTTIGERQAALVTRMTLWGEQSRAFFIQAAADIGYTITISEFRTFVVGLDRCGDNRIKCPPDPADCQKLNEWGIPILSRSGLPLESGELSAWPNYGLGPPSNRFYWTVHVIRTKLVWFRCGTGECGVDPHVIIGKIAAPLVWFRVGESGGQCGIDPHLRITPYNELECLLERWKPAHTKILWDYSIGGYQ
jgi:uncharacterized protein YmfQ (DUF2313 family)